MRVNKEKTKVMHSYQRQWVCGTVVNQKVNMLKRDRYSLKAIVHNCELNGIKNEAAKTNTTAGEFAAKITGKLGWFAQLNSEAGNKLKARFKEIYDNTTDFTPLTEELPSLPKSEIGTLLVPETATAPW